MQKGLRQFALLLLLLAAAGAAAQPPDLPRHYPHIRIAALAYRGHPLGAAELELLRHSIDLVVPHPDYLQRLRAAAPKTPLLIYSNTSNLYLDLLTDWLEFADAQGVSRELAFYHAARPRPFRGHSPSSQPVTWFWRVWRGQDELTTVSRGAGQPFALGTVGEAVCLGFPEKFREINLDVRSAGNGWEGIWEYCHRPGHPAEWKSLPLVSDNTQGVRRSGRVTFDPPGDWKPCTVQRSPRLYYVRLRTMAGTPPLVASILGRDYVEAAGRQAGIVPVFDRAADANGDGYLDDAEYARRAPGKNARFFHESRLPTENYGQMRFLTNPSHPAFRAWAVAHHRRLMRQQPLASGIFMDNSGGKCHLPSAEVVEPIGDFARQQGQVLAAIRQAIAPRWVLANTAGGGRQADAIIRQNPAYFEEFALRPLSQHYQQFEELRELIEQRARLTTPPPLAVLDSHPQNGAPDDPRTQLATLAEYYLLANPHHTLLMFFGGFEPATTWQRHWVPAAARDIGPPLERCSERQRGADPANPRMEYRIYQRAYRHALVLYRPLSHARGQYLKSELGDDSAVAIELGDRFRPLRADNSVGEAVQRITLRNGEGAILLRGK